MDANCAQFVKPPLTVPDFNRQAGERGEADMNALLFQCPMTERPVKTGIEIDMVVLRSVQPVTVRLRCPHCRNAHEWKLTEGLLGERRASMALTLEAWSPCPR